MRYINWWLTLTLTRMWQTAGQTDRHRTTAIGCSREATNRRCVEHRRTELSNANCHGVDFPYWELGVSRKSLLNFYFYMSWTVQCIWLKFNYKIYVWFKGYLILCRYLTVKWVWMSVSLKSRHTVYKSDVYVFTRIMRITCSVSYRCYCQYWWHKLLGKQTEL